jgi:hypothetical protein
MRKWPGWRDTWWWDKGGRRVSDPKVKLTLVARQRGLDPDEVTTRGVEVTHRQPRDARWRDVLQREEVGNGPHLDLGKVQNLFFTLVQGVTYPPRFILLPISRVRLQDPEREGTA